MPLAVELAIIAVVAAVILVMTLGARARRGWRVVGTAAALWVTLIALALLLLTVATLMFGR